MSGRCWSTPHEGAGNQCECLLTGTERYFRESPATNHHQQDKTTQTFPCMVGRINGQCKSRDLRSWKAREAEETSRHPRVAFYMQGEEGSTMMDMYIHDYIWSSASDFYGGLTRFESLPGLQQQPAEEDTQRGGAGEDSNKFAVLKRIMIPAECTTDRR